MNYICPENDREGQDQRDQGSEIGDLKVRVRFRRRLRVQGLFQTFAFLEPIDWSIAGHAFCAVDDKLHRMPKTKLDVSHVVLCAYVFLQAASSWANLLIIKYWFCYVSVNWDFLRSKSLNTKCLSCIFLLKKCYCTFLLEMCNWTKLHFSLNCSCTFLSWLGLKKISVN
jgi:hypothetical protein